jgi:hypothetical protein
MNQLKEILSQLQDKEAEANLQPEDVNPNVRAGVEALVRNAKQSIEGIARQYREAVMANVVIIGVKGKTAKEYAEVAKKLGSLAVDYNLIQDRLTNNLRLRAVGEYFTSDANFKLIDELAKIRLEYDMTQLPTPVINAYNDGIYDAPLAIGIQKLLVKNYGTALESAITRREIGKQALESRFTGKKLPVVIYNLDRDVDARFIPAPMIVIESNGPVTENGVKKKLSEIRAQLNGKPTKRTRRSDDPNRGAVT